MIWIPIILVALICAALIVDGVRFHRENRQAEREFQAIRKRQRIARRWGWRK